MKFNLLVRSRHKSLILTFLLVLSFSLVQAQTKTVKETISGDGMPLPGVSVLVKGTARGTVSDFDENYEISVKDSDVLMILELLK